ncbi:hypothetical protein ACFLRM_03045 [Acidobacteriota bacterium]
MRFIEKLLIFFVALILSVLGFSLISSSFIDLHMLAMEADNKAFESYPAKFADNASRIRNTIDNSSQIISLNSFHGNSGLLCDSGANK